MRTPENTTELNEIVRLYLLTRPKNKLSTLFRAKNNIIDLDSHYKPFKLRKNMIMPQKIEVKSQNLAKMIQNPIMT